MSSTPYDRQISFALYSAENPTVPHSGADIDAEFNAVKVSLDDTQQNLALIQDDDGALARGSVGQAQFDSSVSLGFGAPATWEAGRLYTADVDTVFDDNKFYIANTTHTSGVSFEAANWDELADFTASAVIPDGSITSAKLADGAIEAAKIADGAITSAKLASSAVTTTKIDAAAVTLTKLAAALPAELRDLILPAGLGPLPWSLPDLPDGWDWADGEPLLADTDFPVYRAALIAAGSPHGQDGSANPRKPDARGRAVFGADDMGEAGAAGRLTSATITGGGINGKSGGAQTVTLSQANLPAVTLVTTITDPGHEHVFEGSTDTVLQGGGAALAVPRLISESSDYVRPNTTGITASTELGGSGTAVNKMPPALVCSMIIKAH